MLPKISQITKTFHPASFVFYHDYVQVSKTPVSTCNTGLPIVNGSFNVSFVKEMFLHINNELLNYLSNKW